ncbi:hypothetical protein PFLmoz3_04128 [Pseudomonas fluorescens]|uniref:Uncharacterized protein n=1 Tax=Pseudomonas fluorescens TaxID=294 RepID=A0A120G6S1_PSEFL|nr:hypothetical protein PFLmoz3_04128 [Pseudomonas fluorescens]
MPLTPWALLRTTSIMPRKSRCIVARLRISALASSWFLGSAIGSLRLPWAMLWAIRLAVRNGPMMLRVTQRPCASSNSRLAPNTIIKVQLALLMVCRVPVLVSWVLFSISSLNAAICSSNWLNAALKVCSSPRAASGFSRASATMRSPALM